MHTICICFDFKFSGESVFEVKKGQLRSNFEVKGSIQGQIGQSSLKVHDIHIKKIQICSRLRFWGLKDTFFQMECPIWSYKNGIFAAKVTFSTPNIFELCHMVSVFQQSLHLSRKLDFWVNFCLVNLKIESII